MTKASFISTERNTHRWSKRHSYNANSGVAIIIGKKTGVRNKYCHACARNISPDKHACFRNWNATGKSHLSPWCAVRYIHFIGDGDRGDGDRDSSVHRSYRGWGHAIKKLECANHALQVWASYKGSILQGNWWTHTKNKKATSLKRGDLQ